VQRRTFLVLAGHGVAHASGRHRQGPTEADCPVAQDSNYRLVEQVDRVNHVLVERRPAPDGRWEFTLVDWQTTPEGDRDVLIASTHQDSGFHVQGDISHKTSLWVQSKGGASLMITFESIAKVRVFRHVDRGEEVVLEATSCA